MKPIVKRLLLLTLLVAMVTTMTGCTFGRARIGVEFIPDPLVINRDEEEIVGPSRCHSTASERSR